MRKEKKQQEQKAAFKVSVRVFDGITGQPAAAGIAVHFFVAGFPSGGGNFQFLPSDTAQTDAGGVASIDFIPGDAPGTYDIQVECAQCSEIPSVSYQVNTIQEPPFKEKKPKAEGEEIKKELGGGGAGTLAVWDISPDNPVVTPKDTGGAEKKEFTLTGIANSIFQVTLTPAKSNTGGHQHNGTRPLGALNGAGLLPTGLNTYQGTIGASSQTVITYTAGLVGGQEHISISAGGKVRASTFVNVRVEGLVPLPRPGLYVIESGDKDHPNFTYGKQELIIAIGQIAQAYLSTHSAIISINDLSLVSGGIFDSNKNWNPPHQCHRIGTSVDFNRFEIVNDDTKRRPDIATRINALLQPNNINCKRVVEQDPTKAHFECPGTAKCP